MHLFYHHRLCCCSPSRRAAYRTRRWRPPLTRVPTPAHLRCLASVGGRRASTAWTIPAGTPKRLNTRTRRAPTHIGTPLRRALLLDHDTTASDVPRGHTHGRKDEHCRTAHGPCWTRAAGMPRLGWAIARLFSPPQPAAARLPRSLCHGQCPPLVPPHVSVWDHHSWALRTFLPSITCFNTRHVRGTISVYDTLHSLCSAGCGTLDCIPFALPGEQLPRASRCFQFPRSSAVALSRCRAPSSVR